MTKNNFSDLKRVHVRCFGDLKVSGGSIELKAYKRLNLSEPTNNSSELLKLNIYLFDMPRKNFLGFHCFGSSRLARQFENLHH